MLIEYLIIGQCHHKQSLKKKLGSMCINRKCKLESDVIIRLLMNFACLFVFTGSSSVIFLSVFCQKMERSEKGQRSRCVQAEIPRNFVIHTPRTTKLFVKKAMRSDGKYRFLASCRSVFKIKLCTSLAM